MTLEKLLTPAEVALILNTTISTLSYWRIRGYPYLSYVKVGRLVRYRESDVEKFVSANSSNKVDSYGD